MPGFFLIGEITPQYPQENTTANEIPFQIVFSLINVNYKFIKKQNHYPSGNYQELPNSGVRFVPEEEYMPQNKANTISSFFLA